jgi:outer membrane protein insertion porin family
MPYRNIENWLYRVKPLPVPHKQNRRPVERLVFTMRHHIGLAVLAGLLGTAAGVPLRAQQAPPQRPANPFEAIPVQPSEAEPAAPTTPGKPQTPAAGAPGAVAGKVVRGIEFRGNRRVPQDMLKSLIYTKTGDIFSEENLRRDFMALWNSGRFDDIRLETEPEGVGILVRFVVVERRLIRTINYDGAKSVTTSEILDRFKERKVGLAVEQQYDPAKIQRAVVALKEYLAERGRQFATVDPVIEQIPPSSLKVTFKIKEGPKVKVGEISFEGLQALSPAEVRRMMKNSKPFGVPYVAPLESLFPRTYDAAKLEEDRDRIRVAYQKKGYFAIKTLEPTVKVRDSGGAGWRLPLLHPNSPGKYADLTIPVEEGRLYRLGKINFIGVKFFKTPDALMRPYFGMAEGDVFSTDKLQKGLENLRKLYGQFGYIDFVPEPDPEVVPNTDKVDLTLTADEGKMFFVRRIEFSGNTTTRDKVIRREILVDEGNVFNNQLWEYSILRLNQLGYFDTLKKEDSAEIKRNPNSNTVDITLKVKEKGKNTVGLTGGISGISGSYVGFNYSTNNFLGLGETLSLESQLGTRVRNVSVGFTEPYFLDRPLQVGVAMYMRQYNYNQAREASILAGHDLTALYDQMGSSNVLNYAQNAKGGSVSLSYPLRRSFARMSMTYGYDHSTITTKNTGSQNYFEYMNFTGVAGPTSLRGIRTSHVVLAYSYDTRNHSMTPTAGRSLFISMDTAGSILQGSVNSFRPAVEAEYFHYSPLNKNHTLAVRLNGSMITGYGGKVAPPYSRTFVGGESDLRGFPNWSVSPVAFIPSYANAQVYNADGTARTQTVIGSNGVATTGAVTMQVPVYQMVTPGGDTQVISNMEYRIPIVGSAALAYFVDTGFNRVIMGSQLRIDDSRLQTLQRLFPQAGFTGKVPIATGTQRVRMSTGLEVQVMLPVVNAPFRVYYAYNPMTVRSYVTTPFVADRSMFPNQATFAKTVASYGMTYRWFEKRSSIRFTVGRTF